MRRDWQTHCVVITVWWTFIVFRLVETETCCALACCTNANLFHVDIISHCLLSNHNTCLTFLYNENVLPRVYFILAARILKNGKKEKNIETTMSVFIGLYNQNVWRSTLRTLELFNSYILKWCQRHMWNQWKKQISINNSGDHMFNSSKGINYNFVYWDNSSPRR